MHGGSCAGRVACAERFGSVRTIKAPSSSSLQTTACDNGAVLEPEFPPRRECARGHGRAVHERQRAGEDQHVEHEQPERQEHLTMLVLRFARVCDEVLATDK